MSFIAGNLKNLISFKIKTRHDGYTDQVSRIIITKVFIVASLVMGVDWLHDTVSCIPPNDSKLPEKYIEEACWVKGFYIYRENKPHMGKSGYYGIPYELSFEGVRRTKHGTIEDFCPIKDTFGNPLEDTTCEKLDKYYFLQYQWMPFYIFSMSAMFYLPYMLFRMANTDVISLKLNMKDDQVTCDDLVENYFNHDLNPVFKMRLRFFMNFVIKIVYVVSNVSAFYMLDSLLDHQFKAYGSDWITWSQLSPTNRYDFDVRLQPTPGNRMLPSFGMCDLVVAQRDLKTRSIDRATVVCEISSNILYQYVFLVLWLVLILSITVSSLGVILYFWQHFHVAFFIKNERKSKFVYKLLTFRECQYLEFIRSRDLTMYGVMINKLRLLHSLPLPKLRQTVANKEDGVATAPMLVNGNLAKAKHHHLKHLDSIEDDVGV